MANDDREEPSSHDENVNGDEEVPSADEAPADPSGNDLSEDDPSDAIIERSNAHDPPLIQLVDRIADRAEPLIDMFKVYAERSAKTESTKMWFRIGMTAAAIVTVLSIVGVAAWLTYAGKIDGATFTFLLGLIIGYMLTFIREAIGPTSTDNF